MENYFKLEFKSDLQNIKFARNAGAAFLYNVDPSLAFIQEIKTIISEAVTNIIIHAYDNDSSKDVLMKISYDDEYCYFWFIDTGIGIENIEEAKLPMFTTKKDDERSGLGFTILEIFSDELVVESKKNEGTKVYCKKKINIEENEKETVL